MLSSATSLRRQFAQKFRYTLKSCFMKGHSCCGACSDKSFYLFPQYTFIQYNFYKSLEVLHTKAICLVKGKTASWDIEIFHWSLERHSDSRPPALPCFWFSYQTIASKFALRRKIALLIICETHSDDCQFLIFYIIFICTFSHKENNLCYIKFWFSCGTQNNSSFWRHILRIQS